MKKNILYPDLPTEVLSKGFQPLPDGINKTVIGMSGGGPIDEKTGNIIVWKQEEEGFSLDSYRPTGSYPQHFKSTDIFEPQGDIRDFQDSVISAPNPEALAFNDDIYNRQDVSVYSRYPFSFDAFDSSLPINKYLTQISEKIETYPVVVIEGETGCGKTTQVPPWLLHKARQKMRFANIVVTQPRRIAAISVSRQVCMANRWAIDSPGICGYQIGSEKRHADNDTRLLFCTTGVLLRKLMEALKRRSAGDFQRSGYFTHIVLDEVHERDREMDLLLMLVRKYQAEFPTVKIVIMSATIQADKTAQYFSTDFKRDSVRAPIVKVEGRQFDVQTFYLEQICQNLNIRKPRIDINDPSLSEDCIDVCTRIVEKLGGMESSSIGTAVLVFLPGMQEIKAVEKALEEKLRGLLAIVKLHSDISVEEQRKAFLPVDPGKRKVILATNVAESSITVPDIGYVIDFCLNKVLYNDDYGSQLECLRMCWASKANCRQRAGRAGRVQRGRCYRLVDKQIFDRDFEDFPVPEILRASLCQAILQVKLLNIGSPRYVLANLIDPPDERQIFDAVLLCKEVQALTSPQIDERIQDQLTEEQREMAEEEHSFDGDLTYVGEILANLPIDVRLGKLIIFGHLLGVADSCIVIAAALTVKSFFRRLLRKEFQYHKAKQLYSHYSQSDPLTMLTAYESVLNCRYDNEFRQKGIVKGRFEDVCFLVEDITSRLRRFGFNFMDWTENLPREARDLRRNYRNTLIRISLAAANYPNFFLSTSQNDVDILKRELAGRNHLTTIQISNLPQYRGYFFHDQLVNIFKDAIVQWNHQRLRIFYEQSKAYVEFIDPDLPPNTVSDCVYLAIRMRLLRREMLPDLIPYDLRILQQEDDRLMSEIREYCRLRNQLTPTLIMMTDDISSRGSQEGSLSNIKPEYEEEREDSLLSHSKYALPSDSTIMVSLKITNVITCCRFFAHFVPIHSADDEYFRIYYDLNVAPQPFLPVQPESLEVGKLYVAPHYNKVFKFQRSRLDNIENLKCDIYFVDIGESRCVDSSQLYECPPSLKLPKYQAVRCRLAQAQENPEVIEQGRSKLARNQYQLNQEGQQSLKVFDASVYSVVGDVVALELWPKDSYERSFQLSSFFIDKGFALPKQESPDSRADNSEREKKTGRSMTPSENTGPAEQSYWPLSFSSIRLPTDMPCFDRRISIRIAPQPAEISWSSPIKGFGQNTRIKVSSDSINYAVIDAYAPNESPYLLTASSATRDDKTGGISLNNTTVFTPKPGLPVLLSMLCSPAVELIKGKDISNPIGILCGLGSDPTTMKASFGRHDYYLSLDTELFEEDIRLANAFRANFNKMVDRQNPVITQSSTQFRKMQQEMIETALKLTELRPRVFQNPQFPLVDVTWALKETARPSPRDVLRPIELKMHDGNSKKPNFAMAFGASNLAAVGPTIDLGSSTELELNLQDLYRILHDFSSPDFVPVKCLLCNTTLASFRTLQIHMFASKHQSKEKLLYARYEAETGGSKDTQETISRDRDIDVPSTAQLMESQLNLGSQRRSTAHKQLSSGGTRPRYGWN